MPERVSAMTAAGARPCSSAAHQADKLWGAFEGGHPDSVVEYRSEDYGRLFENRQWRKARRRRWKARCGARDGRARRLDGKPISNSVRATQICTPSFFIFLRDDHSANSHCESVKRRGDQVEARSPTMKKQNYLS